MVQRVRQVLRPPVLVRLQAQQRQVPVHELVPVSLQHRLVEFFQVSPETLRQLSTAWAPATVASAAVAITIATLFNFIMIHL